MVPKTNASPRPATMVAIRGVSCGIRPSSHSRTRRALRPSEAPRPVWFSAGTRCLTRLDNLTKWCLVTNIDIRQVTLHIRHCTHDGVPDVRSFDFLQLLQVL